MLVALPVMFSYLCMGPYHSEGQDKACRPVWFLYNFDLECQKLALKNVRQSSSYKSGGTVCSIFGTCFESTMLSTYSIRCFWRREMFVGGWPFQ